MTEQNIDTGNTRLMVLNTDPMPYVLIDRDRVVREVYVRGMAAAVAQLKPSLAQRVALILDIPR